VVACDNGAGVCAGATRPRSACVGGAWQPCSAAVYAAWAGALYEPSGETRCDGLDNDCSGAVDEDFARVLLNGQSVSGVGASCGVGACAGGATVCNAAQTGIVCGSEASASAEVCDGVDNDCDGQLDAADASLGLVACENQTGVCGGAMKTPGLCYSGAWHACGAAQYAANSTAWEATETRCDARDNDCDGGVDDGLVAPLNTNQNGACSGSRRRCAGSAGFVDDYGAVATYGLDETPDGSFFDENCDGVDGTVAKAWFVAPGGSDSGSCTQASPCATVGYALGKVTAAKPHVYVRAGDYAGTVSLTSGAEVYGGFDASWVRAARTETGHVVTLNGSSYGGQYMAVRAVSLASPAVLADVVVQGANASGTVGSRGKSAYGVYVDSATLTLLRVDVRQGNGAGGLAGAAGSGYDTSARAPSGGTGGNASQGFSLCDGSTRSSGGGGGANSACTSGTGGGAGGQGGKKDSSGSGCGVFGCCCCYSATSGLAGVSASGSAGYGGGTCAVGGSGGTGGTAHGSGGAGASAGGALVGGFWYGRDGSGGTLGSHGGGGGGGGGSGGCDSGTDARGAGGGGGGAGGCRASDFGDGGFGGGGSFGVFAYAATVTVRDSRFYRGTGGSGGAGGSGGRGQAGGYGGAGGAPDGGAKSGGAGGAGGSGGHSGGGGGGGGGVSYAIYRYGGTLTQSGNAWSQGSGGTGGGGGWGATTSQQGAGGAAGGLGTVGTCANAAACGP